MNRSLGQRVGTVSAVPAAWRFRSSDGANGFDKIAFVTEYPNFA